VIADALNQLADWHLKFAQDTESARLALEQVFERFPDSAWSHAASQRLAHLAQPDLLLGAHDRKPVPVPHAEIPSRPRGVPVTLPADDSAPEEAQQLVQHLEQFPADNEARERLATLYAHHYQRLDLAAAELEQLVAQPSAPPRQIVHWLNLLAGWQLELARDEEGARQTLQRIVDLFPNQAAAELARQRLEHLQRELKKTEAAKIVKLGAYEQDLGLKHGRPRLGPPPD
jgi:outer membrane protein assembly factor BamD (BamD/ComL family)